MDDLCLPHLTHGSAPPALQSFYGLEPGFRELRERTLKGQVAELRSEPKPNRDKNTETQGQIYLELLTLGLMVF